MSQSATPSNPASAVRYGTMAARLAEAATDGASRSVYDALTDLFLDQSIKGPAAKHSPVAPAIGPSEPDLIEIGPGGGVRIEGVVLGNLPVLASAWVTQYAREVAIESRSTVAMLRARSGLFTLELVGELVGELRASATAATFDTPIHQTALHQTLDQAILAALRAATWIVCADCEALFGDYLEEGLLDGITLLTGADEPAIVACYRNLKSLVTRPNAHASNAAVDPSSIRLAVMGATAERADDAAHRLETAAETFLGRRPGRTFCISKIGGSGVRTLFRGSDSRSVDELIDLVRTLRADLTAGDISTADAMEPATIIATRAPAPKLHAAHDAPGVSEPKLGAVPGLITGPITIAAQHSIITAPRTLSVHIPGLTALPHRCPYAPEVELAFDQHGGLHLLRRAGSSAAPVIVQLLTARAWAVMHSEMLRAACPSLRVGSRSDAASSESPVMHAFTDHPKDVRGLLDTDVRLHLLARASSITGPGPDAGPGAGNATEVEVWVCRELN